jgi:hypothetical protein
MSTTPTGSLVPMFTMLKGASPAGAVRSVNVPVTLALAKVSLNTSILPVPALLAAYKRVPELAGAIASPVYATGAGVPVAARIAVIDGLGGPGGTSVFQREIVPLSPANKNLEGPEPPPLQTTKPLRPNAKTTSPLRLDGVVPLRESFVRVEP